MFYQASGVIRREYDMKCKLLRHKESVEDNPIKIDKIRASVKDLHSRIRVAIQRIDSISKKIEEIRDKELQPQLEELIGRYDFLLSLFNFVLSVLKFSTNIYEPNRYHPIHFNIQV